MARAIATCPWPDCGRTTPKGYLAAEAQARRMGHQLYCIVYRDSWKDKTKSGRPKKRDTTFRGFAEIAPERDNSLWVTEQLAKRVKRWEQDDILPNEDLQFGNKTKDAINYGMPKWIGMFSPRQQLAHGICVEVFQDLVDDDRQAGKLDELRKAAWGYVAVAFDKLINRNSLMTRWMERTGKVVGTFDSHDFGFKWSYAEMVVADQGYGLEWGLSYVGKCLLELCHMAGHREPNNSTDELFRDNLPVHRTAPPTTVINGPAQYTDLNDNSIDAIVIDPPYHDNVSYAELSDFFYVWLKRTAGYVFPEQFTDYLTDKVSEAIASPARFRDQTAKRGSARRLATEDYHSKMQEIFLECRRVIKDNGIMTVMFTHKRTDAWNALTLALIEAGFTITRTWPVKTEAESSLHIRGRAAARSTILLVCRPKSSEDEVQEPADWTSVQQMIAEAVRNDLDHLAQYDLTALDTYLASYGTALKVISNNWGTQRATANPDRPEDPFSVTAEDALALASRQVMQFRAQQISTEWHGRGADPATRFYVLLSDAVPDSVVPYDEARLFAQAADVELDDRILKHYLHKQGDKVHILSANERLARRIIGRDRVPQNTLDEVHTAMAIAAQEDTSEAVTWLDFNGIRTEDNDFQYTLEALLRTYRPGHPDLEPARNLWRNLYGARRWDTAGLFETAD